MSCLDSLGSHAYNIALEHIKEEKWKKEGNVEKEEENDMKPRYCRSLFSYPKGKEEYTNEIFKRLEEIYDYVAALDAENLSMNKDLIKFRVHSLKMYIKTVYET